MVAHKQTSGQLPGQLPLGSLFESRELLVCLVLVVIPNVAKVDRIRVCPLRAGRFEIGCKTSFLGAKLGAIVADRIPAKLVILTYKFQKCNTKQYSTFPSNTHAVFPEMPKCPVGGRV